MKMITRQDALEMGFTPAKRESGINSLIYWLPRGRYLGIYFTGTGTVLHLGQASATRKEETVSTTRLASSTGKTPLTRRRVQAILKGFQPNLFSDDLHEFFRSKYHAYKIYFDQLGTPKYYNLVEVYNLYEDTFVYDGEILVKDTDLHALPGVYDDYDPEKLVTHLNHYSINGFLRDRNYPTH